MTEPALILHGEPFWASPYVFSCYSTRQWQRPSVQAFVAHPREPFRGY